MRILVVEDDEDDYFIISDFIRDIPEQGIETVWCKNHQDALDVMQRESFDVVFVDYYLTGNTGLDLLTEAMIDAFEAPIILLTGKGNPDIERKAMRLGASDYLIKSELTTEKLERCIRYTLNRAATLNELKESERQYRNIFERTNDVIFIADSRLRILKINEAATLLFEYQNHELLNMALPDLFAREEDKEWMRRALTQNGQLVDVQIALATHSKGKKIGIFSASFETDLKGKRYVQGIIHEITLLKRTEEITIQTEKLEAKGKVIRTLAHEARNPLNNIQLSVANLKTAPPEQVPEYLEIIQRNSKRIDDLINELMDSTRFYNMKLDLVALQSVMDDAIDVAQDRLTLSKIKLHLHYHPAPVMALVDRDKMRIAFLNLIVNAIEAMEAEKGLMTISVYPGTSNHEVKITDNGSGMSEETLQKLFEPYYTSKPKGLGLGLATTQAIIVSHHATIQVDSALGKGSVFTMSFPVVKK